MEKGTAVGTLVHRESMIVIRPVTAVLKYQTDNTSFSQPEGVIVNSPLLRTGVIVREEPESTSGSETVSIIF